MKKLAEKKNPKKLTNDKHLFDWDYQSYSRIAWAEMEKTNYCTPLIDINIHWIAKGFS